MIDTEHEQNMTADERLRRALSAGDIDGVRNARLALAAEREIHGQ